MKNLFFVVVTLIIGIFIGFIIGQKVELSSDYNVVGVYKTDNWNGKTGTLVLYEDGTCLYPTGEDAKWTLDGDIVNITVTSEYYTVGVVGGKEGGREESYENYKAKVIDEGITLNGKFFEKVK